MIRVFGSVDGAAADAAKPGGCRRGTQSRVATDGKAAFVPKAAARQAQAAV